VDFLAVNTMSTIRLPSAEEIRKLRKLAGLTQGELAKRAGVSQALIARIESGQVDPRLSTLRKIITALSASKEKKTAKDIMHIPVITVNITDNIRKAVEIMRTRDVSQLPVLRGKRAVGSIQEATIVKRLLLAREPGKVYGSSVQELMEGPFATVNENVSVTDVLTILGQGEPAVLVLSDAGNLSGIITKIDVVSALIKPERSV
jgi:predicted transcriptional regulator